MNYWRVIKDGWASIPLLSKSELSLQAVIAVLTLGAVWFAGCQVLAMRSALETTERAKLVIQKISIGTIGAQTGFTVTVKIKNVGKLEAQNVSVTRSGVSIGRDNAAPSFLDHFDYEEARMWGPIPPDDVWVWTYTKEKGVSVEDLELVTKRGGGDWLYVYGEFRYEDGFGKVRYTPFCRRYVSSDRHSENRMFRREDEEPHHPPPPPPTPLESPTPSPGWVFRVVASCPFPYPPGS